jgi:hypothetical protein
MAEILAEFDRVLIWLEQRLKEEPQDFGCLESGPF